MMSKHAIASERAREWLKDVLLGPSRLYEALRDKAGEQLQSHAFVCQKAGSGWQDRINEALRKVVGSS